MAIEGQTFVLVASQVLTEENLEKNNLVGNHVTKTVSTSGQDSMRIADVDSPAEDFRTSSVQTEKLFASLWILVGKVY